MNTENTKTVLVVELLWHPHILKNMYLLTKEIENIQFHFLTYRNIFNQTQLTETADMTIWDKSKVEENALSAQKLLQQLNPDLIWLNTFQKKPYLDFFLIQIPSSIPIITTIHNSQRWFFLKSIKEKIRSAKKNLSALFQGELSWNRRDEIRQYFYRKRFSKRISGVCTTHPDLIIPKQLRHLPGIVLPDQLRTEPLKEMKTYSECLFIIPGTVDQSRREYKKILNLFEDLLDSYQNIANKIHLILLGKLNDKEIGTIIQNHKYKHQITFFNDFVPEDQYKEYMNTATHIIIWPLKNSPYGQYKMSGAVADAESIGIPSIISSKHFPSLSKKDYNYGFSPSRKTFDDFTLIVYEFFNDKQSYLDKREKVLAESQKYHITVIKEKLLEYINGFFIEN